jgi:hypothetical protein
MAYDYIIWIFKKQGGVFTFEIKSFRVEKCEIFFSLKPKRAVNLGEAKNIRYIVWGETLIALVT